MVLGRGGVRPPPRAAAWTSVVIAGLLRARLVLPFRREGAVNNRTGVVGFRVRCRDHHPRAGRVPFPGVRKRGIVMHAHLWRAVGAVTAAEALALLGLASAGPAMRAL